MYFPYVNKIYSQKTKKLYVFKMQCIILISKETTKKSLCLCDLTWETKTTFFRLVNTKVYKDKIMDMKNIVEYNQIPI